MRLRRVLEPRMDAPLPLWMIFPVVFTALYASHFTLLRLPYYWDEAGYYIPAAWDFFRTGSLIPITTLTNAHPPLESIYLALWWKVFRVLSRGNAGSGADGGGSGAAGGLAPGHAARRAWARSLSGRWFLPACTQFGLRKARWPTLTFLPQHALCGGWSTPAGAGSQTVGCGALVLGGGSVQGDGCRRSGHARTHVRRQRDSGLDRPRGLIFGERRRGFRVACCRWRPGTVGTTRRPAFCLGIQNSCVTTRRPISIHCAFLRHLGIAFCTSPRT